MKRDESPPPIQLGWIPNLIQSGGVGISAKDFEAMSSRLARKRGSGPDLAAATAGTTLHTVVLGIDPSLRGTGFGIIQLGRPHPRAVAHGSIPCPAKWERSRCLVRIVEVLREQILLHKPTVCAIEGLFYAQNFRTALIMGEARGASLFAAAEHGLEIYEIATRKVKQAIVGYGAAQKLAVAKMVQRMMDLPETPNPDAADALAIALTFAQSHSRLSLKAPRKL